MKLFGGRIALKNDIEANWNKATGFIPLKGELIIYNPDNAGNNKVRFKVGNGIVQPDGKIVGDIPKDLPFVDLGTAIAEATEGGFILGKEEDNLETTSEHSVVSGKDIKAGIRGLKIKETHLLEETNHLQVYPIDEEVDKIEEYYDLDAILGARVYLSLNHHSFEAYKNDGWDEANKCFHLNRFDGQKTIPSYVELAYEEDEVTPWEHGNYMWFYTREDNGSITTFDVSLNDHAPIRPEADFTYALGDNITVAGRSSFSSGQGNQNMGWYSATMGRFNTAYYSAFALGAFNNATGTYAVALNQNTEATATASLSKGYQTKATANYSEAGGQGTEANHKASFAHGFKTKSGNQHQAVFGQLNEETNNAFLVVGNGKSETLTEDIIIKESQTIKNKYNNIIKGTLKIYPCNDFGIQMNNDWVIEDNIIYGWEWDDQYIDYLKVNAGTVNYETGEIDIHTLAWDYLRIIYDYTKTTLQNAFTVKADGSAVVQTQGTTNNSVVIKQTLDAELNKQANEIAKNIDEAIAAATSEILVDASNAARDLDSASHRYTDSLGDYFTIEDEWLDSCVQPTTQERGNYFITKLDANATSGGVIKNSANYIKEYTDNFKYSLDVCVTEANTSVSGFDNAVGPHINIGTFDGVEVYIQFRVGSLFLWGVEKLGDKIQTTGLGTTTSPAQVTGAKIEVGKNYKVEIEKNGSTLFCTVGEYHFTFVEKQPLTFVPNFLINCRYANCSISNRKLILRDNKLANLEIPVEIERSAEGAYLFGENLNTTIEHGAVFGKDTRAGVRGLRIVSTHIDDAPDNITTYVVLTLDSNGPTLEESGYNEGELMSSCRAALALNHLSFDRFGVTAASNRTVVLNALDSDYYVDPEHIKLSEGSNFIWFYKRTENEDGTIRYDVSVNDNAPIIEDIDYTYSFGKNNLLTGLHSFSAGEGNQNISWYSTTFGKNNIASYAAFAAGANNYARGTYSAAINQNNSATETASFAKGYETKATANYAESGGLRTEANHEASFAHGRRTVTGRQNQAVLGEYNKVSETALLVVGNGDSLDNRSNAFVVEKDGSATLAKMGESENSIVTKKYLSESFVDRDKLVNDIEENVTLTNVDLGSGSQIVNETKRFDNLTVGTVIKLTPNITRLEITDNSGLAWQIIYGSTKTGENSIWSWVSGCDRFQGITYGGGQSFTAIAGNIDEIDGTLTITNASMSNSLTITYTAQSIAETFDLGFQNIVPGSIEIWKPEGDWAPIVDSGDGVLYQVDSGRADMLIDYKTGIISGISILSDYNLEMFSNSTIFFRYYRYNETEVPSTKALNDYVENQFSNQFDKLTNYIANDNDYVYLETPKADRELYGYSWYNFESSNEFFDLTSTGFENASFNEDLTTEPTCTLGANPKNTVDRFILFSNNYFKSYEDFLFKIDIDLKDIYASQTSIKGATGPIIFPFANLAGIQFRQNGSIVCGYGGTTTVISNKQINQKGKYTIYLKYMKALGKLNIYKDSLDNLLASVQLTDAERANAKPRLAFGGRCCTYSADCEIHKATFEFKPISEEELNAILIRDPYTYYTIEE